MADDELTVNLKILSPSTEVEGGVSFSDLPAATTIAELRSRIHYAVPSKPATERMRLIYRGRVVANGADTLRSVFGPETIRENKDQSLHLVLRELPGAASSSPAPRAATAPPNPHSPAQPATPASPPLQTNPFRTIPQPRPNSQPQLPPQQQHHPHQNHHHHHHPHYHPIVHQQHVPANLPPGVEQIFRQTMAQHQQAGRTPAPVPGQPPFSAPAQPSRTVRQEGIGPNGERWSVTINETNVNLPHIPAHMPQNLIPRPVPLPPGFALPPQPPVQHTRSPAPADVVDRLLPRIHSILQAARREMENVRTFFQGPGGQSPPVSPPRWRLDSIREHVRTMTHNLDMVEQELAVVIADASMAQNRDVNLLRDSANELRLYAEQIRQWLASEQDSFTSDLPTATLSHTPVTRSSTRQLPEVLLQPPAPTMPAGAPPELFIVSSPQGPVGVLFDQQGTYTMAPVVPVLPFQTFTDQFMQNRQLIAGLGQQMVQSSSQFQLHNQLANMQPNQTQPATTGGQPLQQPQNQIQNQNQNLNQPANANGNANPPEDRMVNIAGHLWLIFKLACFVWFFAGGGGWYRPIMLGLVACAVYLAQIGIFEEHFNLIRRHFEAVLPVGALAERAAQPRDSNNAQAQQPTVPTRNMTPEQAAQRLLQQRRDQRFGWVRDSFRTAERSLAIFVASLWPGIGERMVHAQEERIRAERVAEEERLRLEEEARVKAAEEEQQREQATDGARPEGENGQPSGSAKGKERVETAGETAVST